MALVVALGVGASSAMFFVRIWLAEMAINGTV